MRVPAATHGTVRACTCAGREERDSAERNHARHGARVQVCARRPEHAAWHAREESGGGRCDVLAREEEERHAQHGATVRVRGGPSVRRGTQKEERRGGQRDAHAPETVESRDSRSGTRSCAREGSVLWLLQRSAQCGVARVSAETRACGEACEGGEEERAMRLARPRSETDTHDARRMQRLTPEKEEG
jgi:hypothetical protein